jgi:hypothetical protein
VSSACHDSGSCFINKAINSASFRILLSVLRRGTVQSIFIPSTNHVSMVFLHFLHPTLFSSPVLLPYNSPTPRIIPTIPPPYHLTHDYSTVLVTRSSIGAPNATAVLTSFKPQIAITGTSILSVAPSATVLTTLSSRPRPTKNTQSCNGHVEFCDRKFSNISMVVAHNSPFVVPHNIASNQDVHVLTQLNDGIRGCAMTRILLQASTAR